MGDREIKNILNLKMDKILSETLIKPAKVLNSSSPRSPSFFNPALLDSSNRTPAEPLDN
jgi:hypothetical protein